MQGINTIYLAWWDSSTTSSPYYFDNVSLYAEKNDDIFTDTVNFEGAQIRITGEEQALRFVFTMEKSYFDKLKKPEAASDTEEGFGTVVMPSEILGSVELGKNTTVELDEKIYNAQIVPAVNLSLKDDSTVRYTVCITDISDFEREYVATAYVTDSEGNTVYGERSDAISVYDIAELAYADSNLDDNTKQYLLEKNLNVVDSEKYPVS